MILHNLEQQGNNSSWSCKSPVEEATTEDIVLRLVEIEQETEDIEMRCN